VEDIMNFFIVNAFTKEPFGGNSAGVVIYDELSPLIMQKIAGELRFSETAFIKPVSGDTFKINYFTPNSEIELCGHATIASFDALKFKNLIQDSGTYFIKTITGTLPVHFMDDFIFMETSSPSAIPLQNTDIFTERLAKIMNIDPNDIGDAFYDLPPQIISTGIYDIMLPVKNINILNEMKPDFDALAEFSKEHGVVGVHAFSLNLNNCIADCRNFAPLYAINEESATGTSNASLTYYLFLNKVINELNIDYIFKQGEKMGRPSKIITKIINDSEIKILVGGSSYIISEGNLIL
jgi:PhzF family phenazine biosynthesis protein